MTRNRASAKKAGTAADIGYISRKCAKIEAGRNGATNTIPTLTRSLDSTKEGLAMNATHCLNCQAPLAPTFRSGRPRQTCNSECLKALRRARYAKNPRPRVARPTPRDRLYQRLTETQTGCLEWAGYRNSSGYGQIGINKRVVLTHRLAWEIANGPIPDGLVVRHRCDNPPCANVDHLELGTHADNVADAVERGRSARGLRLPQTVLSDADVVEIRRRYRKFTIPGKRGYRTNRDEIAAEYGLSPKYVGSIASGRERPNA